VENEFYDKIKVMFAEKIGTGLVCNKVIFCHRLTELLLC
jgi:hypothetical protein